MWSSWITVGSCSVTCGDGLQTRHRACDNPSPSDGGQNCLLMDSNNTDLVETDTMFPCNKKECPEDEDGKNNSLNGLKNTT